MSEGRKQGTLYLVATPIGNLEDLSHRALRTLGASQLIAAEDTRRTRKLLAHYGISRPLVSYYEQNEAKRIPALLEAIGEGKDVALVSDAGSPGISDPGYRLVREAIDRGISVTALPGPSAVILALSISGLPTDRFTFFGFLPRGGSDRKRLLQEAAEVPHTVLFFESPHRLVGALEAMLEVVGDRQAAVCRELTKRFEEVDRGMLSELAARWKRRTPKGEFCIVMEGRNRRNEQAEDRRERLARAAEDLKRPTELPLSELARRVARKHGLPRRAVYQLGLELKRLEEG